MICKSNVKLCPGAIFFKTMYIYNKKILDLIFVISRRVETLIILDIASGFLPRSHSIYPVYEYVRPATHKVVHGSNACCMKHTNSLTMILYVKILSNLNFPHLALI